MINCFTWLQFQENLLMAAIKGEQEEMAFFLVDNGVNYNYIAIIMVKI